MQRCLELAEKGFGKTSPNPMVGCVIVCQDKIIGEGFHEGYGQAHAEVNAIHTVRDKELLRHSTLYVSLEPCSHYGKTPPCSDLIIRNNIPAVVFGSIDPNPLVSGKGLEKLKGSGISLTGPVLENECRFLNRRFFTFYEKKRPYIILKWAQSKDGFMDRFRSPAEAGQQEKISNERVQQQVHCWRSQEQAVVVGTNTALLDNPRLNVRLAEGRDPVRIVIDRSLRIPSGYHLLDDSSPTLIFTDKKSGLSGQRTEFITFNRTSDPLDFILDTLFQRNIQSLIVEGGARLIASFLSKNLWDEARVISSQKELGSGVRSPAFSASGPDSVSAFADNSIAQYFNTNSAR